MHQVETVNFLQKFPANLKEFCKESIYARSEKPYMCKYFFKQNIYMSSKYQVYLFRLNNLFCLDCLGAVASMRDSYTGDLSSILIQLFLHHGDNRGRHSANHNLLPVIHLSVQVLHVTMCLTPSLLKMSGRYLVKCKVM